ncbi:MAG: hypothetical protein ABSC48_06070 [Terracidiphilus sp.]|jgi:hypothetical protein
MERVLSIPLSEVGRHFEMNTRQDVKIIAPEIMSEQLFQSLSTKGRNPKREERIKGDWKHSGPAEPNGVCLSEDFSHASTGDKYRGPLAVSFANEEAPQDEHYHKEHVEMYYSEHPFSAECRVRGELKVEPFELDGGALIVGPDVIHKVHLTGMTIIVEFPAITGDKFDEPLRSPRP